MDRFWDKVDKTGDCWEWTACTRSEKSPYGVFWFEGKNVAAHRFAWEQVNGPVPSGLFVIHSCDNPPCVNINHLSLGTPRQNMVDTAKRARRKSKLRHLIPDIHAMKRKGWKVRQIARYFSVDHSGVSRILNGKMLESYQWQ